MDEIAILTNGMYLKTEYEPYLRFARKFYSIYYSI